MTAVASALLASLLSPSTIANQIKEETVVQKQGSTDESFAQWMATKHESLEYTDRLIIEFADKNQGAFIPPGLAKKLGLDLTHVKVLSNGKHIVKMAKPQHLKTIEKFLAKAKNDQSIKFIEPDLKRRLFSQIQPWGIAQTQSDQLSDADASNMTVCIIDSGYQQSNPDLTANNASGTNNSGTGNWYQAGGSHGTHVAGTIAGINNSEGVVGVMPNANVNLHIIKVFNESGWGYSGDLVDAVNACANNGAKVINMSLGGSGSSVTERNALQSAADSGILLVAASGNDGNNTLSYPASYDSVMAVGALDSNNQHAEFSQYTSQVEISAPGEAILSTVAGDGRLGNITIGGTSYSNDQVAPQTRFVQSGSSYVVSDINGSASGVLSSCSISGSGYSCSSNVAGNICLVERNANQAGSSYPEINGVKACADAGAAGIIVFSNTERPGLQNPFLVDGPSDITVPTVSVDRTLGNSLASMLGNNVNLTVTGNEDYAYYNGTSMATPHVAGIAALVWSNNPTCSASEVRNGLKATAMDIDVAGRDDRTGYGIIQAKAASDYLATNCGGTTPPPSGGNVLDKGVAKTNLSANTGDTLSFTIDVPAGASNLTFNVSGGTGDADLYVRYAAAPTSSTYDCRPYESGNNESCSFNTPQTGTYYVNLVAYNGFSGVSLVANYDEDTGGGATGGSSTVTDISVNRREWKYYSIDVPAGMSTLAFALSGGTGDADMYIRQGAQPTSSTYDCRPYESGNNETCSFNTPAAGTWHIGIYGYRASSGMQLDVSYNP